jgi:hypothetical protein
MAEAADENPKGRLVSCSTAVAAGMIMIMVPDLLDATEEIGSLGVLVRESLREVLGGLVDR